MPFSTDNIVSLMISNFPHLKPTCTNFIIFFRFKVKSASLLDGGTQQYWSQYWCFTVKICRFSNMVTINWIHCIFAQLTSCMNDSTCFDWCSNYKLAFFTRELCYMLLKCACAAIGANLQTDINGWILLLILWCRLQFAVTALNLSHTLHFCHQCFNFMVKTIG